MSGRFFGRTAKAGLGFIAASAVVAGGFGHAPSTPSAYAAGETYELAEAWPGATFEAPIAVAAPRDASDRVFVIERKGRIQLTKKFRGGTPVAAPRVFLDITALQMPPADIENGHGGLLNMAIPPDFEKSGRFYVLYGTGSDQPTNPYRSVLASYRVSATNPNAADPASGEILLTLQKPHPVHFGGGLCFGNDGMLYVAFGDKAEPDDPSRVAQNMTVFDGKVLRLDVRAPTPGRPYSVPGDNPWPNIQGVRAEIFAYGLRHPWRMAFDRDSGVPGALWLGDVGQKKREEIDVVSRGGNLGWGMMEGNEKLDPNATPSKYVAPVYEYGREMGKCVIGGFVYRGQRCTALRGSYLFADSSAGSLWALPLRGTSPAGAPQLIASVNGAASIDQDAQGEPYIVSLDDEKIFTLVPKP